jgi:hypothetical protein
MNPKDFGVHFFICRYFQVQVVGKSMYEIVRRKLKI